MLDTHERSAKSTKKKLAILVNMLTPYRLPVYGYLARYFETIVMHGGREAERTWDLHIDPLLRTYKAWGFQAPGKKRTGIPSVWDRRHIHFNLGLIWKLPLFRPDYVLSSEMGLRTLIALAYGTLTGVPVWIWRGGTIHSEQYISKGRRVLRSVLARSVKRWISY